MIDERNLISRFEAADAQEMIQILYRPTFPEEKALRAHLGDVLYQRMHGLALRCRIQRERERPRGNVVVIPGFLGSELRLNELESSQDARLWLNIPRIMEGSFERLRLSEDSLHGLHPGDEIHARGLIKRQYGELLMTLSRHWNVRGFAYDWRKDIEQSSGDLLAKINAWFGVDAPVHIVAHGMGGLIARAFICNQRSRWKSMQRHGESLQPGGRLVMLGTANHGSFLALRTLVGESELIRGLTQIDKHHDMTDLLKIVQSFVSIYQMLPSPRVDRAMSALFDVDTYHELHVSKRHLRKALSDQARLAEGVDVDRMIQILGFGYRTITGISDMENLSRDESYVHSSRGDGVIALDYARLREPDGEFAAIPSFYIRENYAGLVCSPNILSSIDELLEHGTTSGLETRIPPDLDAFEVPAAGTESLIEEVGPKALTIEEMRSAVGHLDLRDPCTSSRISPEERSLSDFLVRGLTMPLAMSARKSGAHLSLPTPKIEFEVVCGLVAKIDYDAIRTIRGHYPIDVIAVGHYIGVKPQGQELDLDDEISQAHLKKLGVNKSRLTDSDRLLTLYSERGIIRGELGQPFFLDDPRAEQPGTRLIAIAGMGLPGRFGVPELSVLTRELVWSVGRLGKRHLCAAPIGTKNDNLSIEDAISGWVRGVKAAITGVDDDDLHRILKISFAASDPRKIWRYDRAIRNEQQRLRKLRRLEIEYTPLTQEQITEYQEQGLERDRKEFIENRRRELEGTQPTRGATRVTLGYDRKVFRFGAITENASIPERTVALDPELVEQANQELAAESDPDRQLERGRFLERLVVPNDLRQMMSTDAPLVMMMDASTARIHWEMAATSDPVSLIDESLTNRAAIGGSISSFEFGNYFLGTSRGFTRQLRTTFAPPPEPPPPLRRLLRVLVVADPAEDARLPGAETEGVEVADLFEAYNRVNAATKWNRVEVTRLLGPREATRTNVLRELMIRSYDVLHFAGHCVYDTAEPRSSGWIFTKGQRISAAELTRIDRVPRFIFSNACESGITPDRAEDRNVDLAPTFAESFFERGVSNFVCTAWPVDDGAARLFALNLYAQLLGLRQPEDGSDHYQEAEPAMMVDAMRESRLAIATLDGGIRTWGAYQHYGNPYFRFFAARPPDDEPAISTAAQQPSGETGSKPRKQRNRAGR